MSSTDPLSRAKGFAVAVLVRTVLSLINAQKQLPMPEPDTWKW